MCEAKVSLHWWYSDLAAGDKKKFCITDIVYKCGYLRYSSVSSIMPPQNPLLPKLQYLEQRNEQSARILLVLCG